jgi:hypothetical protein
MTPEERAKEALGLENEPDVGWYKDLIADVAASIRDAEQAAYVRGFEAAEKTMVPRAVGDEREACMWVADRVHDGCVETDDDMAEAWREAAFEIAEAIRKRGDL